VVVEPISQPSTSGCCMSTSLKSVLGHFEVARKNGSDFMARCPAHEDKTPSLSITERNGMILFKCHAGCTFEAICAAAKIDPRDLSAKTARPTGRIVAKYDYVDESGVLLSQVLRFDPKKFKQRKPDGEGGWIPNTRGVRRVPYNLPEVLRSNDVIVCEGEKDCETARTLGLVATCNPGGAGKWFDEYSEYLRGKNVVVIADADEPGRKHARQTVTSLHGKVGSLKLLEIPGAKDLTEWRERGCTRDALVGLIEGTPEWKPEVIDGAELLMAVYRFVRRFVSLSEAQAVVVGLWVAHTHAFDSAEATPYLAVTSAEKQCGKTRLLEVLQTIVRNPWLTGRVTAAVLVRKIDIEKPTLLLDESDAAFGGEKEYAEALRGVLNTGHRRGGVASLCVGKGMEITFKDFSTFSAKCIAGIGKLPGTVADRSMPIRLKRAAPDELVERFRLRNVTPEAGVLRGKLETWCETIEDSLRDARPNLPDELSDRQQDGVEPLLAIADAAGKGWPEIARSAVVELCTDSQSADDSIGVRLLTDIRQVFGNRDTDKIPSTVLGDALAAIEISPWGEWSHGKPITAPKLARLLRPFGVTPHTVRMGNETSKGYELADFEDSFKRYLRLPATSLSQPPASKPSHPSHPSTDAGSRDFFKSSQNQNVTVPKCETANTDVGCDGVTVSTPIKGMEGQKGKHPVEEVL
jgi:hypothetical protein